MKFKYRAISISGIEQTGKIEANNIERAADLLQKHKLFIVSIKQTKDLFSAGMVTSLFHRVSYKKIVMFSKELSILLTAGVSLTESLRAQHDQEEDVYFKEQLFKISNMVEDGATFSAALSKFPDIFSDFYINIVRTGEASGRMQESLLHLSDHIEKQYILKSKVKGALMYPAVVMSGFIIVGLGMMAFVVPQLVSMFKDSGQELPLPTKVVIFISDLIQYNFILIILTIIGLVYVLRKFLKTSQGKMLADTLIFKIPQFNNIFKKFYVARFSENLSILVSSGVPIINALEISGNVVGNEVYKKAIYGSIDEVKIGGSIAYSFERSDQIPPLVSKMIRVGERTGKLDTVLKDVASFYTKEVDIAVDSLSSIIEPIMIFVLGGAVAILVASILMPIYQMTEVF